MTHQTVARVLLAALCGLQGLATPAIDLNRTHATNFLWPGHARFHIVWQEDLGFKQLIFGDHQFQLIFQATRLKFDFSQTLVRCDLFLLWSSRAFGFLSQSCLLEPPDSQMRTGSLNGDLVKDGFQGGCSLCDIVTRRQSLEGDTNHSSDQPSTVIVKRIEAS